MDSYINSQLDFANRMNDLVNFEKNDAFTLAEQRMQEFRSSSLSSLGLYEKILSAVTPMQNLKINDSALQMVQNSIGVSKQLNTFLETVQASNEIQNMVAGLQNMLIAYQPFAEKMISNNVLNIINNFNIINFHPDNISEEEKKETEEVSNKIISEILKPEKKQIYSEDSTIIKVLPVNERLLQYLADNPNEWYNLKPRQFEEVMAEIYRKLGYRVELTQETRDGGKDLIVKEHGDFGDLIYYVECKHYSQNNPVGLGIIQRLQGVINCDRVNMGILATTSFFSRPAREYVLNHNLEYQIKLQDYNSIQALIKRAVG